MAELELLRLDLRSPLHFSGMENPPLVGAPLSGTILFSEASGSFIEVGIGRELAGGEEELFLFDEEELVEFDPDEGPIVCRPLPRPLFYGRRPSVEATETGLSAGSYAFLQWRPESDDELAAGLEWFVKQAWWERVRARGPYFLRRIHEDGGLATQALRRISP